MMKKLFAALLTAFALLWCAPALASNCSTYPFTLTNGTLADANQVMANFNSILSCANTNLAHNGANSDITSLTGLSIGTLQAAATQNFVTGAWTPAVSFATPGSSTFSYATQVGHYSCIGNILYEDFVLAFTPTIGTGSGTLLISGMPYPFTASTAPSGAIGSLNSAFTGYTGSLSVFISDTTHLRILYTSTTAGGSAAIATTNLTNGSSHSVSASLTALVAAC